MVKQWFESLDLDERVLSVTTIDLKIAETVKYMVTAGRRPNHLSCKFRMFSSTPPVAQVQIRSLGKDGSSTKTSESGFPRINYVMSACNT
jgi:hypothetical protein